MAKKQSKYERPGGARKGRIAVVIFIIVAAITDAIMIRAYFTGGKSAMVGASDVCFYHLQSDQARENDGRADGEGC